MLLIFTKQLERDVKVMLHKAQLKPCEEDSEVTKNSHSVVFLSLCVEHQYMMYIIVIYLRCISDTLKSLSDRSTVSGPVTKSSDLFVTLC